MQRTHANWNTGDHLRNPSDVWARCPCEPEEANGEEEGASNHWWEALFGDDTAVLLEFAGEAGLGGYGDGDASEYDANHDTNKWQRANTHIPATLLLEGNGKGFEEEVENTINHAEIYRNKQ